MKMGKSLEDIFRNLILISTFQHVLKLQTAYFDSPKMFYILYQNKNLELRMLKEHFIL